MQNFEKKRNDLIHRRSLKLFTLNSHISSNDQYMHFKVDIDISLIHLENVNTFVDSCLKIL